MIVYTQADPSEFAISSHGLPNKLCCHELLRQVIKRYNHQLADHQNLIRKMASLGVISRDLGNQMIDDLEESKPSFCFENYGLRFDIPDFPGIPAELPAITQPFKRDFWRSVDLIHQGHDYMDDLSIIIRWLETNGSASVSVGRH